MTNRAFWDGDIPWVSPKDMKRPSLRDSLMRISRAALDSTPIRLIPAPAVLMVVRGMILAKRVPVALTAAPLTINQDVKAMIPTGGVTAGYLALALETASDALQACIDESGHGTRRLPTERWRAIPLPIPPPDEQAAIVRFIDHADRRIRRYIREKQKLIGLLDEQKQAIIHRAVTRGLDPHVRLKPSGVEWLGDVPEHWEVLALRRRWQVTDCKHLTVPFVDEGYPLASVREAQTFELSFASSNRTTKEWFEKLIDGGRRPKRGDLVYCRNVNVGAAALVTTDEPFAMGQDVCLIRSERQSQRWLNYFLRSHGMKEQLGQLLVGSTFNRINVADIKALLVVVPPRDEQDRIVAHLDREVGTLNIAINELRTEQALIREYRTRLIADVVTGKLDVRAAAAALPDEPAEDEPLDALTDDPGDEAADTEESDAEEEAAA